MIEEECMNDVIRMHWLPYATVLLLLSFLYGPCGFSLHITLMRELS